MPETSNPRVVIGCHGLLADRNSLKQIALASACNRIGVAYFRFDHRGCGDSQGDFARVTTLTARCRDLYHAVNAMKQRPDVGPLAGLFGSSFGGTVVLAYAAENESPAVVTYAAPINSTEITHSNIRDNNGESPASEMLTDALGFDIASSLNVVNKLLVAHSQGDETVPVEHARRIHASAGDPKQLLIFKGGDHRMSKTGHQKRFETAFISWLKEHSRQPA